MDCNDLSTATHLLLAFFGFSSIAGLSWFFSSRPRLFLRVFGPADHLLEAARGILRDPHFGSGMRLMAKLQFGVAAIFGLIGLGFMLFRP